MQRNSGEVLSKLGESICRLQIIDKVDVEPFYKFELALKDRVLKLFFKGDSCYWDWG